MNRKQWIILGIVMIVSGVLVATVLARPDTDTKQALSADSRTTLGSGFTYQGQLSDGGGPVSGDCEMAFRLYNHETAESQVGGAITTTVPITDGLFTVVLNGGGEFGSTAYNGEERWLGIRVKCSGDLAFADLGREKLFSIPYASYAQSAPWSGITGVPPEVTNPPDGVHFRHLIVVAKSGGDYTSIQAALDSITDTLTHQTLVWVAPGTYTETVTMRENVDIEGAGELSTKITYVGSDSKDDGTILGADNAELRFLTVENTGGADRAVAILNDGTSPRLYHVTAIASGSTNNFGVLNNNGATPMMLGVSARTTGGEYSYGVRNNISSPVMIDVNASASGASYWNTGIRNNNGASPTMRGVTAFATGGQICFGVYNYHSTVTMTHLIATAMGSSDNRGVHNQNASVTLQDSILRAVDGGGNIGINNYATSGAFTVKVINSQITASDCTIGNGPQYTTLIGSTFLNGGSPTNYGTMICAGVYDADYTFYADTCP